MGKLHNFIITQLFTNPLYQSTTFDTYSLCNSIYDILNDYSLVNDSTLFCTQELIDNSTFINDMLNTDYDLVRNNLESELFNVDAFSSIAINLDSILLSNYISEYSAIVQNAYNNDFITAEAAWQIRSFISVYGSSRYLWRNYMPDPDFSEERLVYCEDERAIHIFSSIATYNEFISANSYTYWGIPHTVHGKVAEIYFYRGGYEYNSQISDATYQNGMLYFPNVSYYFDSNNYIIDNYIVPSELTLHEVPKTNHKIYYVKLYD